MQDTWICFSARECTNWTGSSLTICLAFRRCNYTDKLPHAITIDAFCLKKKKSFYSITWIRICFSVSLCNYVRFLIPDTRMNTTWWLFIFLNVPYVVRLGWFSLMSSFFPKEQFYVDKIQLVMLLDMLVSGKWYSDQQQSCSFSRNHVISHMS